jgi:hypothetical protein
VAGSAGTAELNWTTRSSRPDQPCEGQHDQRVRRRRTGYAAIAVFAGGKDPSSKE